jgi:hypothetical protein
MKLWKYEEHLFAQMDRARRLSEERIRAKIDQYVV